MSVQTNRFDNQKCRKFQMADGEQIPRATMNHFVKSHCTLKVSGQFTDSLLQVAKNFIRKVTDKANDICEEQSKKTINAEHFYKSLKSLGMEKHVAQLRQFQTNHRQDIQAKQEHRQKVQEKFQLMMRNSQTQKNIPSVDMKKETMKPMSEKNDEQDEDYMIDLEQDQGQQEQCVEIHKQ